jgi:hypothetical protein
MLPSKYDLFSEQELKVLLASLEIMLAITDENTEKHKVALRLVEAIKETLKKHGIS